MIRKTLALAAVTALAVGGAASAATVDKPIVMGPGEHIPIDFAGFKEPADKHLPKNHRIVRVHVEIAKGKRASVVLTAPEGFRAVTIGMGDGHQVGAVVGDVDYPGKRSVRVKLWAATPGHGGIARGTLYLLARRA